MSEREQFEAWVLKNWQTVHRENGRLTWHDSSVGTAIGHAWDGWQAGIRAAKRHHGIVGVALGELKTSHQDQRSF